MRHCSSSFLIVVLLCLPALASAQEFPVAIIDRPTAFPELVSVYTLNSTLVSADAARSTEHAATVAMGISDEVDLGVGLPPLLVADQTEFGAPSIFASYGWDITNEWAVYPTITYGFPVIADDANSTLTVDALVTFTPNSTFDFGLQPTLETSPDANASAFVLPAYAFYQASERLHVQLDGALVFAGDSSGEPTERGLVLYSGGLTWGYTLGRSNSWILDILATVARDISLTDRDDYVDAWRGGLALAGVLVP